VEQGFGWNKDSGGTRIRVGNLTSTLGFYTQDPLRESRVMFPISKERKINVHFFFLFFFVSGVNSVVKHSDWNE
jgi:hypothetical protein